MPSSEVASSVQDRTASDAKVTGTQNMEPLPLQADLDVQVEGGISSDEFDKLLKLASASLNAAQKQALIGQLHAEVAGPEAEHLEDIYADRPQPQVVQKNGIMYIHSKAWIKEYFRSYPCHLYVGLPSVPTMEDMELQTPDMFKIVNKQVIEELYAITGMEDLCCDHLVPYRSIIQFEHRIREACDRREAELRRRIDSQESKSRKRYTTEDLSSLERLCQYNSDMSILIKGAAKLFALETTVAKAIGSFEKDFLELLHRVNGLKSLVHLLDHGLKEFVQTFRDISNAADGHSSLTALPFHHLWYLYSPGTEIVCQSPKHRVYRVLQATRGRRRLESQRMHQTYTRYPYLLGEQAQGEQPAISSLEVLCFYIDFDGKSFRPVKHYLRIEPYKGKRPITDLPAFPLSVLGSKVRETLIQRGKKFEDLAKVAHRQYKGLSLQENYFIYSYEEVDGDVIIDFELAYRSERVQNPDFEGPGILRSSIQEDQSETLLTNNSYIPYTSYDSHSMAEHEKKNTGPESITFDNDSTLSKMRASAFEDTELVEERKIASLCTDAFVLLPYRVYAYVLLTRKWLPLDIDLVKEISPLKERDSDGFKDLILPEGHKAIVRALVKTHARSSVESANGANDKREFDLVKGKGKGLIILLHGAPGVGKTSTAECVAANTGRPLFPITCGDIGGNSAREVESNLEHFFDFARKWGCVLLLDEADVFLAERTKGDMKQNSLVSVFLRVLEYYSGILILTTNRVGEFDEAIKSRVHCALYYPPLTKDYHQKVWKLNIKRLGQKNATSSSSHPPVIFDPKEIKEFAKENWKNGNRWNGRQIKNAFQTAVALADWDYMEALENRGNNAKDGEELFPVLTKEHFKKVAKASEHFETYLNAVRKSDVQRARAAELRLDEFTHKGKKEKSKKEAAFTKLTRKPTWAAESSESSEASSGDGSSSDSATDSEDKDEEKSEKVSRAREAMKLRNERQKNALRSKEYSEKQARKAKEKAAKEEPSRGGHNYKSKKGKGKVSASSKGTSKEARKSSNHKKADKSENSDSTALSDDSDDTK